MQYEKILHTYIQCKYKGTISKYIIRLKTASYTMSIHDQYTVETRYNAVLGVHRSDPRYIRVDGYNAVYVPPPAHEWPVSAVDRLIL